MKSQPEFLGLAATAELLDCSEKAVRARVDRRQIPFHKWRGRIVFIRAELDSYFRSLPGCSLEEALLKSEELQ